MIETETDLYKTQKNLETNFRDKFESKLNFFQIYLVPRR